jgi:hypothetical protein
MTEIKGESKIGKKSINNGLMIDGEKTGVLRGCIQDSLL